MNLKLYSKDDTNSPESALEQMSLEGANKDNESQEIDPFQDETDDIIIGKYREHKSLLDGFWNDLYKEMAEDWDIYTLDQWTEDAKNRRGLRPKLTADITRKYIKKVISDSFTRPPKMELKARKASASDKAKALADAVRYFESTGNAKKAYSWSEECSAVCGIGFFKETYEEDPQQKLPYVIKFERVSDPLSVKIDIDSQELDGSDMMYAVEEHGKIRGKEKCTYWWKSEDGTTKWALIHDGKVEDKGLYPVNHIPIFPVYGELYRIKGKIKLFGLVRQLKDTQRTRNYSISEMVERLALTPKSPIEAPIGSIPQQYAHDWAKSLTEPVPIVFFAERDANGNPIANKPTRSNTTPDISWANGLISLLDQNARETSGIYDSAMGNARNDMSGIAIKTEQNASDKTQLTYDDNLKTSIRYACKVTLDLINVLISPSGTLPMLSEDGSISTAFVGSDPMMMGLEEAPEGAMILEDLDPSDLDIAVTTGSNYSTRKEEAVENITKMLPYLQPEQQSKLIPKLMRDMDFPNASEYADILDPQSQAQGIPPEAMAQAQEQITMLNQQLQKVNNDNMLLTLRLNENTQAMLAKAQIDAESRVAVANINAQAKMASEMTKANTAEMQTQAETTIEMTRIAEEARNNAQKLAQEQKADTMGFVDDVIMDI